MRRADRLLRIVQILRRARKPVTAQQIADELELSIRTIYRDIADLLANGVPIAGEAGVGYVLRAGYDLPPLMFSVEEIEALVLGAQMVAQSADASLGRAADDAIAKIAHVLPGDLRAALERTALFAPSFRKTGVRIDLALVRTAIRRERKLFVAYQDAKAIRTERVIWPLAVAFFADTPVVGAWCELRRDFRHFRADRIESLEARDERFDPRGGRLMRDYLRSVGAEGD